MLDTKKKSIVYLTALAFAVVISSMGGYKIRENFELQTPVVLQSPFKHINSSFKNPLATASAAMMVGQAYAKEEQYTIVNPPIDTYIIKVFGKDSWKAFKLLACENATHNPDTVNVVGNYPRGSRDIGVFQINEYWQATNSKFLFNYKINIEVAKQLYDENNSTFALWSCGKTLGI